METDSFTKRFENHRYISIETYRRNGDAVRTPVWFVSEGSSLYIRTYSDSGKAKRLKLNGKARVAPCTFQGEVLGDWVDVEPSFADRSETARVLRLFRSKYGIQIALTSLLAWLKGKRYVVIKLSGKS
ncbi:MAG: PPOX class F420-dependent oxidoreductase [Conexivisphaerales archaeon]